MRLIHRNPHRHVRPAGTIRRRVARLVGTLAAVIALGAGGGVVLAAGGHGTAYAASSLGGQITQAEVIQRAWDWYDRIPAYSYCANTESYCSGIGRPWRYDLGSTRTYRPDCSGFVDMAWHLSGTLPNTDAMPSDSRFIPVASAPLSSSSPLQPGDLLLDITGGDHHAVLFEAWNAAHTTFSYFSFGGGSDGNSPPTHSSGATFSGTIAGHPGYRYAAYRYRYIMGGTAVTGTPLAFQANTGFLWARDPSGGTDNTQYGMLAGTSPAVTMLADGSDEIAFQGNDGFLYVRNSATGAVSNTEEGPLAGTSPDIASNGSGWELAFQSNDGFLYTMDSTGHLVNTQYGMMRGTSPAITAVSGGGYEVAFQANNGFLYTRSPSGVMSNTEEGPAAGTSPDIAANGSGWEIAFQGNDTFMYTLDSTGHLVNTQYGMLANSSPALTGMSGGGYEVAFQGNNGFLYVRSPGGVISNTEEGPAAGTSPDIISQGSGWELAFQGNDTFLYTLDSSGSLVNTEYGMLANTSPAI
jgi:hypothetical protein